MPPHGRERNRNGVAGPIWVWGVVVVWPGALLIVDDPHFRLPVEPYRRLERPNRSCTALDEQAAADRDPAGGCAAGPACRGERFTPVMLVDRATGLIYANRPAAAGMYGRGLVGVRWMISWQLDPVRSISNSLADQPEEPGDWARRVRLPLRRGDGQELTRGSYAPGRRDRRPHGAAVDS